MRVLILGGSGFVGAAIARRLLAQSVPCAVLDIVQPAHELAARLPFFHCDVTDQPALSEIFCRFKPTHVIHNAAIVSSRFCPKNENESGVISLIGSGVLDAMVKCDATKLIYASSAAVYGDVAAGTLADERLPLKPQSQYAQEKAAFELHLQTSAPSHLQIETVVFRFANVYGNGQLHGVVPDFLACLKSNSPVRVYARDVAGDGGCLRDYVYIDDVVDAHILALNSELKGTFNVSTGIAVTTVELLQTMCDLLGYTPAIVHEQPRPLEIKSSVLNPMRLINEGWGPAVNLSRGMAKFIDDAVAIPV